MTHDIVHNFLQAHKMSCPRRSNVATCGPLAPPRPQSTPQIPVCTTLSLFVCVGFVDTFDRTPVRIFQTNNTPVELEPAATYRPLGLQAALDHVWTVDKSLSRSVSTTVPVRKSMTRNVESIPLVKTLVASTGENRTAVTPPSCRPRERKQPSLRYSVTTASNKKTRSTYLYILSFGRPSVNPNTEVHHHGDLKLRKRNRIQHRRRHAAIGLTRLQHKGVVHLGFGES